MNTMKKKINKYWLVMLILGVWLIVATGGPSVLAETVADALKGQGGVTGENMKQAQYIAKPFADLIGNITGFILVILVVWQALQTTIDLFYYYVPISRNFLMPNANPQQGGMTTVVQQLATVSDDMIKALGQGSNQPQNQVQPGGMGMGGMQNGMGMGGMQGGMGMQSGMGMGAQPQAQQPQQKNVITSYLKYRMVTLIFLTIAITVLVSSTVLTDTGLNLGAWIVQLLENLNGKVEEQLTIINWFIH